MWKEAKNFVKKEYPDLYENTPEFISVTLDEYAIMTKAASYDELIENLYSENVVSKNTKIDFDKFATDVDILEKVAAGGSGAMNAIALGAASLGAAALVAGGINAASDGFSHLRNKLQRKKNLANIYKYNPHLRGADPDRLNQTLSDMESLNPSIGRTPIIAGTLLSDAMTEDGIHLDKAKGVADLNRENKYLGVKGLDLTKKKEKPFNFGKEKKKYLSSNPALPATLDNSMIYDPNFKGPWHKKANYDDNDDFVSASNFFNR